MSHQKWALDTPSARKMVKNLKLCWTPCLGGPKMWDSVLPDGSIQSFYFANDHPTMTGWFKGMKVVLEEWGLFWLQDNGKPLNRECKDFKCTKGAMDCCCCCILFNQPDFTCVKSHLEEVIMACRHLYDFYPKFHCELNYTEQYWGAVKLLYRSGPWLKKMDKMEKQVAACLDDITLLQIWRYGFWNYIWSNHWLTISDQSGLLIIQHILWMHIRRASMVLKQSGKIESTMAIECYQTTSWKP